jgi:hypothetical protein
VKQTRDIPGAFTFQTRDIAEDLGSITEAGGQAAFVLRRLQALYLLSIPGVPLMRNQGKSIALELSRLLVEICSNANEEVSVLLLAAAQEIQDAALDLSGPGGNANCVFI